jgi:hypothetical protein
MLRRTAASHNKARAQQSAQRRQLHMLQGAVDNVADLTPLKSRTRVRVPSARTCNESISTEGLLWGQIRELWWRGVMTRVNTCNDEPHAFEDLRCTHGRWDGWS